MFCFYSREGEKVLGLFGLYFKKLWIFFLFLSFFNLVLHNPQVYCTDQSAQVNDPCHTSRANPGLLVRNKHEIIEQYSWRFLSGSDRCLSATCFLGWKAHPDHGYLCRKNSLMTIRRSGTQWMGCFLSRTNQSRLSCAAHAFETPNKQTNKRETGQETAVSTAISPAFNCKLSSKSPERRYLWAWVVRGRLKQ